MLRISETKGHTAMKAHDVDSVTVYRSDGEGWMTLWDGLDGQTRVSLYDCNAMPLFNGMVKDMVAMLRYG